MNLEIEPVHIGQEMTLMLEVLKILNMKKLIMQYFVLNLVFLLLRVTAFVRIKLF